jgi:hypothetical protein
MTDKEYEDECKLRIELWHGQLKDLGSKSDSSGVATVKALIDAELALAEVRIKVRQAGHPKLTLWLPIIFPTLGAILGAILGGLLKLKP